jgi:hypothetical protein
VTGPILVPRVVAKTLEILGRRGQRPPLAMRSDHFSPAAWIGAHERLNALHQVEGVVDLPSGSLHDFDVRQLSGLVP